MTARKAGIISEEENEELNRLIAEDEEARILWEQFNAKYSDEAVQQKFDTYAQDRPDPRNIINTARPHPRKRMVALYRFAGAAVLILGIISVVYFLQRKGKETQIAAIQRNQASKKENAITLSLANGQQLVLSGSRYDSLAAGSAVLNNSGRSLNYTVASNGKDANATNVLTVPIGMDYQVVLSDGTKVWLNSATELRFPFRFTGNSREISINGEAYLEVTKMPDLPFIVHSSRGEIQVLGTSFNMNSYDSGVLNVSLVEGAVRLKTPVKAVDLHPGQAAIYRENKGIELAAFDEDQVLSWRKGLFVFDGATLPEITAVMPRWFGIKVSVDNPRLRKERFTGVMNRNAPVKLFMENLKTTMNIEYYFDKENTLHIQ